MGAKLTIDGKEQTLTAGKLVIEENEFGAKLNLVTEKLGHVKDEQTVTIEAKDNVVEINLAKDKFKFEVTVTPADAKLTIDGKEQTLTAGKLVIDENEFGAKLKLVTEKLGHVKNEQTVTIQNAGNKVDISLPKKEFTLKITVKDSDDSPIKDSVVAI